MGVSGKITAIIHRTKSGWIVQTDDAERDLLAGPFETEIAARSEARKLDIRLAAGFVGDRSPGDLFRIGNYWYRIKTHSGKKSVVAIVGEDRTEEVATNTPVTQISVLSLPVY